MMGCFRTATEGRKGERVIRQERSGNERNLVGKGSRTVVNEEKEEMIAVEGRRERDNELIKSRI